MNILAGRNHCHINAVTQRRVTVLLGTLTTSLSSELPGRGCVGSPVPKWTEIIPGSCPLLAFARMTADHKNKKASLAGSGVLREDPKEEGI